MHFRGTQFSPLQGGSDWKRDEGLLGMEMYVLIFTLLIEHIAFEKTH